MRLARLRRVTGQSCPVGTIGSRTEAPFCDVSRETSRRSTESRPNRGVRHRFDRQTPRAPQGHVAGLLCGRLPRCRSMRDRRKINRFPRAPPSASRDARTSRAGEWNAPCGGGPSLGRSTTGLATAHRGRVDDCCRDGLRACIPIAALLGQVDPSRAMFHVKHGQGHLESDDQATRSTQRVTSSRRARQRRSPPFHPCLTSPNSSTVSPGNINPGPRRTDPAEVSRETRPGPSRVRCLRNDPHHGARWSWIGVGLRRSRRGFT